MAVLSKASPTASSTVVPSRLIVADAPDHGDELRVAARNEKQKIGERDVVGEPRRQRMAFEVVDGDERLPEGEGEGLAGREAHHDAADQSPGPAAAAMPSRSFEPPSRPFAERAFDQPIDDLHMGAARQSPARRRR